MRPGSAILEPTGEVLAAWEALADRVGGSPFVRPGFLTAWHDAFGTAPWRLVCDVADDGHLRGLLPLVGRLGTLSSPTNWHTPDFQVLSEDDATTDRLLAAAVADSRTRLQLSFVDEALSGRALAVADRLGRRSTARVLQESRYVAAPDPTTPTPSQRLNSDTRKKIRRRRRQLEELGPVELRVHEDLDGGVLEEFLRVEHSGWKGGNRTSILTEPGAEDFYRTVAAWAAGHGLLRLALLVVGERVVAGDLAVDSGGSHYVLKTGFVEDLAQYRPGHLLRLLMIERAHEEGLVYEFLGDDAEWKRRWTPTTRTRMRVNVFGPGLAGRATEAVEQHVRPRARDAVTRVRRWRGSTV